MIDNFITYEDPAGVTEDGYLSKLREEMFQYGAVPPQHYSYPPQHHQYPPQVNPIMHGDHPSYEVFSHNSAYSTNPSTKESPEHTPLEDHLCDDGSGSRVPPIVRKGIRKYYEPIVDNGMVYNYEDDPSEYRKARKRIQNRESATRVRNRKKNHVEILEDEIIDLKKVISDLKTDNSHLHSENQNLKHKLAFFEKAVAKNNQAHQVHQMNQMNQMNMSAGMPNGFAEACPPPTDHILDFMDSNDQIGLNNRGPHHDFEVPQPNMQHPGFYRASNNSSKFKKHMALLGVFTLLLCVYGILPRTGVQLFALPKFNFGTSNNVSTTPQPNNHNEGSFMNGKSNTTTVNPTSKPDEDFSPNNMQDKESNVNKNHEEGNKNFDPKEPQSNNGPNNQKSPPNHFNANKNKTPAKPNMKNGGGRRDFRGDPRDPRRRGGPPPNRGHHRAWGPNQQQKNQESNTYTVSILSVIEILVVACYSIYFIYVGFSAYKLHAAKKRRGGAVPVPL